MADNYVAMDLDKALAISASGLAAQSARLRVVAENLANQDSTGSVPGGHPYRRKTISFSDQLDQKVGADLVQVQRIGEDMSDFPTRYDPSNPAADASGYVKVPNVNALTEMMDMRDADRTYAANLSVMQTTRNMLDRTIDLLK